MTRPWGLYPCADGYVSFLVIQPAHWKAMAQWIAEGKLKHRETVVQGLERAPEALNMLFDGANTGKLVVKVADPPLA